MNPDAVAEVAEWLATRHEWKQHDARVAVNKAGGDYREGPKPDFAAQARKMLYDESDAMAAERLMTRLGPAR